MDNLKNDELAQYIKIIETNQTVEAGDSKFNWMDLKEAIEKELYVRNTTEIIMNKLNIPISREWK